MGRLEEWLEGVDRKYYYVKISISVQVIHHHCVAYSFPLTNTLQIRVRRLFLLEFKFCYFITRFLVFRRYRKYQNLTVGSNSLFAFC